VSLDIQFPRPDFGPVTVRQDGSQWTDVTKALEDEP
jgi:hypothetical protein